MRKAFVQTLLELAKADPRIMLLTSDLGFMVMEPFIQQFPKRFLNVGVAEQNMVGIATGLAEAGFIPYVYSITPFAVLRPYEFLRNGPIYHQLMVRIVGSGSGFDYGHDGISHFNLDDIGVLRVQPGISVFAPADHEQAAAIFRQTWALPGPVYYRLGRDDKAVVPGLGGAFAVGEAQIIGDGRDLLIIGLGSIASEAVIAIEQLASKGISCTLMVVSSVVPPPLPTLAKALPLFRHVLTVEAHYLNGGLGSLVSEIAAEGNYDCTITRCGVKTLPDGKTGSQGYLHGRFGLSSDALVTTAVDVLQRGTKP